MSFLSQYELSIREIRQARMYGEYNVHRVIWSLFPLTADGKTPGRILYADKGMHEGRRRFLILSTCAPQLLEFGELKTKSVPARFYDYAHYRFEIVINPARRDNKSGMIKPVTGFNEIHDWFLEKSSSWGFELPDFQIDDVWVNAFWKENKRVTLEKARIKGVLTVRDHKKFVESATNGIGRGKAFGCGLLQLAPVNVA